MSRMCTILQERFDTSPLERYEFLFSLPSGKKTNLTAINLNISMIRTDSEIDDVYYEMSKLMGGRKHPAV